MSKPKQKTMKKILIGTVTTAIILFFIQALNWTALPVHKHALKYTPDQKEILELLDRKLDEGYYYLPYYDPDNTTSEEQSGLNAEMEGKPWAVISFHESYDDNMAVKMTTGFIMDLMSAFIVVIILAMVSDKIRTFGGRWLFVISMAALIILQGPLMNWNWWSTPDHFFISLVTDQLSTWGIAGLWLAWYLRPAS